MKRKPRFFIGFLAAAVTFGTLMATLGPRHYKHHQCHHHSENNSVIEKSKSSNF